MGRLKGTRVYLAGPMDRTPDGGVIWRDNITKTLHEMGIFVLNPCRKPVHLISEDEENRKLRQYYKETEQWDKLTEFRIIRGVDLRMVDVSDFLIVNIDLSAIPFGTTEEIVTANREKKIILVWAVQGKKNMPDWLFWMIPHEFIFNTMEEIVAYLKDVDNGNKDDKRWIIFNFSGEEHALHKPRIAPKHRSPY